ncbi:MAG: tetratricopeptide repeat protein [Candidatus Hermodarchaeota archaeon]
MSEIEVMDLFETCELDIKEVLRGKEPLTFLVGAGISMDPPSGLPSARQMIKDILCFGAVKTALDKLFLLQEIRYESLVEMFRDRYDNDLKLMDYFEEVTQPNSIHRYLAQMIRAGHYVMTTNFDYLIETVIGLDDPDLKVVITHRDFEEYGDPIKNREKGLLAIYKIHGCRKNPVTNEDTRESIITTLDALGRGKAGEIFSVEPYKRLFFKKVTCGRTLVIMGYSGGDDFDIIPTLLQMDELKRVIWITHVPKEEGIRSCQIRPNLDLNDQELTQLGKEDQILYRLSLLGEIEVIKIFAHTSLLVSPQISSQPVAEFQTLSPFDWMTQHIPAPEVGEKEFFTGRIFLEYAYYRDALYYLQKSYRLCRKHGNVEIQARAAGNLGLAFMDTRKPKKALQYHQEAYQLHERLKDPESMVRDLNNTGLVYMDTEELEEALIYLQRAYDLAKSYKHLEGMGRTSSNQGIIHIMMDNLTQAQASFQQAYDLFQQIGNLKEMAINLSNLGLVYKKLEKAETAIEHYQKAYEINERIGALEAMAINLGNLGNIHMIYDDLEQALENHQKAYILNKRLGNHKGMSDDIKNIGMICSSIFSSLKENLQISQYTFAAKAHLPWEKDVKKYKQLNVRIQKTLEILNAPRKTVEDVKIAIGELIKHLDSDSLQELLKPLNRLNHVDLLTRVLDVGTEPIDRTIKSRDVAEMVDYKYFLDI